MPWCATPFHVRGMYANVRNLMGSVVRNRGVFNRATGGSRDNGSLNIIDHGLLRGNARVAPLDPFRTVRSTDPRLEQAHLAPIELEYASCDGADRRRQHEP